MSAMRLGGAKHELGEGKFEQYRDLVAAPVGTGHIHKKLP